MAICQPWEKIGRTKCGIANVEILDMRTESSTEIVAYET